MSDPTAIIGGIGLGATALGGIFGAAGASQQAKAQQGMYNYQAGMAKFNSVIALQNADYARDQGERQVEQYGLKTAQQMGGIRSAQAASGLDVNTGSAAAVQSGQRQIADIDMTQIRSNAAKTAYNFDVESKTFEQQAQLYTYAGENAAAAGQINIMSSILGSVGGVSNMWLKGQQVGIWGGG
ncbi:MAG: hypothetical protein ACREHG_04560 [Candidatus Saccharimonadales bacterium]